MAPTTASDSSWLVDLWLVDTQLGTAARAAIEIVAGRVATVAEAAPPGSDTLSLGGAHVLPGLISCHTHLQAHYPYSARDEGEDPAVTFERAARQAVATLDAGITTVRCLHEQAAVDVTVRAAIKAGRASGPRIFAAGRGLTVPGGHGAGLGCRVATGEDGFRDAASAELAAGADHVKVFASGGLARPDESMDVPEMTLAEMRGAVAAARERGTYVVAHAASSEAIRLGLEAGIRSFEHAYRLDAETAGLMAEAGAFLTPTLVVTHLTEWKRRNGLDPAAIERSGRARERHVASIQHALSAGVTIVNGTDFPPGSLDDGVPLAVREMELLVAIGATPLAAIQAASVEAARLVGAPELGQVAPGAPADLIAVDGDPLSDITAMERISMVMQAGVVVRH